MKMFGASVSRSDAAGIIASVVINYSVSDCGKIIEPEAFALLFR